MALVGCGERDKARRIGAAIFWAIDNDRTWHDGRLRNAYAAGVVVMKRVSLPFNPLEEARWKLNFTPFSSN